MRFVAEPRAGARRGGRYHPQMSLFFASRRLAGWVGALALLGCDGGGESDAGGPLGELALTPEPAEPACTLTDREAPLCSGEACPFAAHGELDCGEVSVQVAVAPRVAAAPVLLLDSRSEGSTLRLADPVAGTVVALEGVPVVATVGLDTSGEPRVAYAEMDAWLLRSASGVEQEIPQSPPVFVALGFAATGERAVALAQDGSLQLVLAVREEGEWTFETIAAAGHGGQLAVADSGRPLVAFRPSANELAMFVSERDPEPVVTGPLANLAGYDLIAGPSIWEAVFFQDQQRLGVARRGHPPLVTAAGAFPIHLGSARCWERADNGAVLGETCSDASAGVTSDPVAVRGASGSLNAFVIVEESSRTGHYQLPCAGCELDFVVDESVNESSLVHLQVTTTGGVERLEEVGRYPLGVEYEHAQLSGEQTEQGAALAISAKGLVRWASIDLEKL